MVVLSALEIDTQFNVNVLTGSDGVLRGASGGHCDTAIASALSIIVAPLVRGRIPTLVDNVLTCITPGSSVDILVTDHGIAVNPARPELAERLQEAGIKVVSIEWLRERARLLTGEPQPIEFTPATMRYQFPSCSSAGMKGKHGNTSGSSAILFHWSPLPWLRLGRLKTARSHAEFLIMA